MKKGGKKAVETATKRVLKEKVTLEKAEGTVVKKAKKEVAEGEKEEEKLSRLTIGVKVQRAAAGSSKMLGMHASAAGSVERAIYDALSIGCRSFALFVRNQRRWESAPMEESTVERWKGAIEATTFPIEQILPHGSYLLNCGSPDATKLQKSRECMLDECQRGEKLGLRLYNFHPGTTTGACSREECIREVARSIDYVIQRTQSICLVVETMAGQGGTVGGTFEELRDIIEGVKHSDRVGVCIDTCHIFAAGYDIRTREKYDETMDKFGELVGFKRLKGMHLNDSKGALGSHLDRHERIGKGLIGLDAFRFIMNDSRFDGIPMVLETPEGDYANEMLTLYSLEEKKKQ